MASTERTDGELASEVVIGKGRGGQLGRVQLIAICRRLALEEGDSLDHMVWRVMAGLAHWGARGDAQCAKLFLYHVAKYTPDADAVPEIVANITNNVVSIGDGPKPPSDIAAYLAEIERVAGELEPSDVLARLLA